MKERSNYLPFLKNSRFLEHAPDALLNDIANIAEKKFLRSGELLFAKGDVGDNLYIILDGKLRVHDDELTLIYLTTGHVVGEIASFGSFERTASVTAESDCNLLEINTKELFDTLSGSAGFTKSLVTMLCAREKSMASRITDHTIRVRALEKELEIGRQIQSCFLPDSLPEINDWHIDTYFKAAREVAGDFYDAFVIKSMNAIAVVIGDVCDKGVGAAMFMTLFRSLLRASALSSDYHNWNALSETSLPDKRNAGDYDLLDQCLRNSLTLTNNYIAHTHNGTSMFASIFFALIDIETGTLRYINAGHEEPVIFSNRQIKQRLNTTGPVAGIFPDAKFEVAGAHLQQGDILLLFTDGITEAHAADESQYTESRLLSMLKNYNRPADELLDHIMNSLNTYIGDTPQYDDNTLLSLARM